jgi:hypothetical protein
MMSENKLHATRWFLRGEVPNLGPDTDEYLEQWGRSANTLLTRDQDSLKIDAARLAAAAARKRERERATKVKTDWTAAHKSRQVEENRRLWDEHHYVAPPMPTDFDVYSRAFSPEQPNRIGPIPKYEPPPELRLNPLQAVIAWKKNEGTW